MAHPFWDKYLEFEERMESHQNIFALLERIIHIPMHQYARYFERYRQMAQTRPVAELAPADVVAQFSEELQSDPAFTGRSELEVERELRARLDKYHMEIFHRTQTETTRRWTYEQEIKRPYFHVTELDDAQLENWRKYLDFEQGEGDYDRTLFLYERCLVACAYYDEFWLRYARWMQSQPGKEEEVHWIYMRGCCHYAPIGRPFLRSQFAMWEESQGRAEYAREIYRSIIEIYGIHVDTVRDLANLERRQHSDLNAGIDAAQAVLKEYLESDKCSVYDKAWFCVMWANLEWKNRGSAEAARQFYQSNLEYYLDSRPFFINWFRFEIQQPSTPQTEETRHSRLKELVNIIRTRARISPLVIHDLSTEYLEYLKDIAGPGAANEYVKLDVDINGPFMSRTTDKARLDANGDVNAVDRRIVSENGHPGVEVNEAAIRRGENPYTQYFQQQQSYEPGGSGGIAA
jgi:pre-mRNA-processing factor 39